MRYLAAADLVETLYRGLADNTVGKPIEALLRNDVVLIDEVGFAPLDDTGCRLSFRFVAAAYERRALDLASHHSFEDWGRFMPEHATAASLLDRPEPAQEVPPGPITTLQRAGTFTGPNPGT